MIKPRDYKIESEQETDGRWLAEVIELPGVMAYGLSKEHAESRVEALALRVLEYEIPRDWLWGTAGGVGC